MQKVRSRQRLVDARAARAGASSRPLPIFVEQSNSLLLQTLKYLFRKK